MNEPTGHAQTDPSKPQADAQPHLQAPLSRLRPTRLAHWIAMGMGSGLSPWAPGTVGTLWAWVSFLVLQLWLDPHEWLIVMAVATAVGWWACTETARDMRSADPSCIVWDEIVAFWLILLMISPAGLLEQSLAFVVFRFFDAVKPPPVSWADQLFKPRGATPVSPGWLQGAGILLDDGVAALCTLLLWAAWRF